MVNVVQLLALTQDREAFLSRLKARASVCDFLVMCTAINCKEKFSYAEKVALHTLVKGLVDEEISEAVMAKTEEMKLDETVKFVGAKEAGHRSTAQLNTGGLASTGVNKLTSPQVILAMDFSQLLSLGKRNVLHSVRHAGNAPR